MNKTILKTTVLLISVLMLNLLLQSCTKEGPLLPILKGKVLILNQGNFTEQSASISLYDEQTNTMTNRVFESANGGISIGATIVSGLIDESSNAFLVCNYPDKILVIDPATAILKRSPITQGLSNPRAICGDSKNIYVSNWGTDYVVNNLGYYEYTNSYIAVYDAATHQYKRSVAAGTDAEGLIILNNKLYVATKEGVRVFDTTDPELPLIKTIRHEDASGNAKNLAVDKLGKIWASFPNKGVVQIDPTTLSAISAVEVPVDFLDGYICADGGGERILTYNTTFNDSWLPEIAAIYGVNISTKDVSTLYTGNYFYGVGASPATGNIYTAEVSFTSNSLLRVLDSSGSNLIGGGVAGVGTSRYLFF